MKMIAFAFFALALMATSAYGDNPGLYVGVCSEEEEWTNFAVDWRNQEYGQIWHLQYYYDHDGFTDIECASITRDNKDAQISHNKVKFVNGTTLTFKTKSFEVKDHSVSDEPFLQTEYNVAEFGSVKDCVSRTYNRQYILTRHILGVWVCIPDKEIEQQSYGQALKNDKDKPDARYIYVREKNINEDVKEVNPLVFEMSNEHKPAKQPSGYSADSFEGKLLKVTKIGSCKL